MLKRVKASTARIAPAAKASGRTTASLESLPAPRPLSAATAAATRTARVVSALVATPGLRSSWNSPDGTAADTDLLWLCGLAPAPQRSWVRLRGVQEMLLGRRLSRQPAICVVAAGSMHGSTRSSRQDDGGSPRCEPPSTWGGAAYRRAACRGR